MPKVDADPHDRAPTAVQITPYLWLAGFGGDIRPFPGGPDLRVSKSVGELLKDLDAALFVAGLVRIDRFVAVSDISHTSASRGGLVPTGNPVAPVLPAEGRLRQTSWTLAGGYRHLMVDWRDRGARVDARLGGPLLGASFIF